MDSHVLVIDLYGMSVWQKCVCVFARVIIGMNQVRAVAHFIQATTSATSEHRWWGCLSSAMLKTHVHVHARLHARTRTRGPPTLKSFNICSDFDGTMTVVKVSDHISELHDKLH